MIFKKKRTNQKLQNNNENMMILKQSILLKYIWKLLFTVVMFKKDKNCKCQRKSSIFIPLKNIDVVRRTHTTLDVLQVKDTTQESPCARFHH